jgi:hypothetical protein
MDMETQKQQQQGSGGRRPDELEREGSSGIEGRSEGWAAAGHATAQRRAGRLRQRDRDLVALLGICRYLTARQPVELGTGARTEKSATYKLRGLAGEATRAKVRPFEPALLRALAFRAFDGQPFQLWALTAAGYAVAGAELGRLRKVPRVDVGAAFAEHSVFLTDLLVTLARPLAKNGLAPRDFPFRWDVVEDIELPWREKVDARNERSRVIRPDAVLEIPASKRRIFIECEMGTHTFTPESPDKLQATVRKVERYDAYVSGFADHRAQVSHYQRKYPDGWPCELVFLVQTEARERRTNKALTAARDQRGTRVPTQALTLKGAAEYCRRLFPVVEDKRSGAVVELAAMRSRTQEPFYGEFEQRVVNDFVLDMTAALNAAKSALQQNGLVAPVEPPSKAAMVEFLRKAQVEMRRQRAVEAGHV